MSDESNTSQLSPQDFDPQRIQAIASDLGNASTEDMQYLASHGQRPEVKLALLKEAGGGGLKETPQIKLRQLESKMRQAYFRESYGRELIPYLDELIKDKQDIIFKLTDFPRYSLNTLQARIRQSIDYIYEFLDTPEGKYKVLKKEMEIRKLPQGIVLCLFSNSHIPLRAHKYSEYTSMEELIEVIKVFIEKAPYDTKCKLPDDDMRSFLLKQEEIEKIEELCSKFSFINAVINSEIISLVKFKEQEKV